MTPAPWAGTACRAAPATAGPPTCTTPSADPLPGERSACPPSSCATPRSSTAPSPPRATPRSGGAYEPGKVDNIFSTFSAGGHRWLVLTLELWARPEVVSWARTVVEEHPQHNVIIQTHSYLNGDGSIAGDNGGYGSTSPRYLWDNLVSQYPNVKMVFSGHVGVAATRTDTGRPRQHGLLVPADVPRQAEQPGAAADDRPGGRHDLDPDLRAVDQHLLPASTPRPTRGWSSSADPLRAGPRAASGRRAVAESWCRRRLGSGIRDALVSLLPCGGPAWCGMVSVPVEQSVAWTSPSVCAELERTP